MLKQITFVISLCGILSFPVQAAFGTPNANSNGWGGWTRGDSSTLYAEWDVFRDTENVSPDFSENINTALLTETTGGGFVTSGNNIYSFSVPIAFSVNISGDGDGPQSGSTQVAMQIRTLGEALDNTSVRLGALIPDETALLFSGPFGGSFGGDVIETLFIWNLTDSLASYNFTFMAALESMSLDRITFDIGSIGGTSVPIPAAIWMFISGLLGFSVLSRTKKQV